MFDQEIAINQFQLEFFQKVVGDLSDATLFQVAPGHGHTPAWIVGHLAICAELGQAMLGGDLVHPDWKERFGPQSVDSAEPDASLSLRLLSDAVVDGYRGLQERARTSSDVSLLEQPHVSKTLSDTPIKSVADMVSYLLTGHFAFHLSQLSSCRRSAGHSALF